MRRPPDACATFGPMDARMPPPGLTPAGYGRWLAQQEPPITDEQAAAAARILATVEPSNNTGPTRPA